MIHVDTAKHPGPLMAGDSPSSRAPELSDDEILRGALQDYLDRQAPVTQTLADAGRTAGFMSTFQVEGLLVPESNGGSGASLREAFVVAAESGASLLDGTVLASLLAQRILTTCPAGGPSADLLSQLAGAQARFAIPVWLAGGAPTATGDEFPTVLGGTDATHVLAFTGAGEALQLVAIECADPSTTRQLLGGIDPTRRLTRITLSDASTVVLAEGESAAAIRADFLTFARLALAVEQSAGARRCVAMTVDYALTRHQFGVAIGSFQAVKHACAMMHVQAVEAQALVTQVAAAFAAADGNGDFDVRAMQAKAMMSESFTKVARKGIEVHGGIGFAWEHPIQLFYKRALATAAYYGPPEELYLASVAARRAG
jgi:Acyl-CoA dehydrogenase, C-terminal domain